MHLKAKGGLLLTSQEGHFCRIVFFATQSDCYACANNSRRRIHCFPVICPSVR